MDTARFDGLTKDVATGTSRRRLIAGLGALALGGAGLVGLTREAAARDNPKNDKEIKRCLNRCQKHNNNNNGNCHERCRRSPR